MTISAVQLNYCDGNEANKIFLSKTNLTERNIDPSRHLNYPLKNPSANSPTTVLITLPKPPINALLTALVQALFRHGRRPGESEPPRSAAGHVRRADRLPEAVVPPRRVQGRGGGHDAVVAALVQSEQLLLVVARRGQRGHRPGAGQRRDGRRGRRRGCLRYGHAACACKGNDEILVCFH